MNILAKTDAATSDQPAGEWILRPNEAIGRTPSAGAASGEMSDPMAAVQRK